MTHQAPTSFGTAKFTRPPKNKRGEEGKTQADFIPSQLKTPQKQQTLQQSGKSTWFPTTYFEMQFLLASLSEFLSASD